MGAQGINGSNQGIGTGGQAHPNSDWKQTNSSGHGDLRRTRATTSDQHLGWWLTAAFVTANLTVLVAAAIPALSLAAPAIALLAATTAIGYDSWRAHPGQFGDTVARLLAVAAIALSWACAVGAASVGWSHTSAALPLFFGWVAVLALRWPRLRRLPWLLGVSLTIALFLAAAGVGLAPTGELGLHTHWLELIPVGLAADSFAPALILGGATLVITTLARLGGALANLNGAAAMRALGSTFAGLCLSALVAMVTVAAASAPHAPGEAIANLSAATPWAFAATVAFGLLALGMHSANGTGLSTVAGTVLTVGLVAVAVGGVLTSSGLATLATTFLLLVLAATFALIFGMAAAAGLVRDSGRVRALFARRAPRRVPAAITAGDLEVGLTANTVHAGSAAS